MKVYVIIITKNKYIMDGYFDREMDCLLHLTIYNNLHIRSIKIGIKILTKKII